MVFQRCATQSVDVQTKATNTLKMYLDTEKHEHS